MRALSLGAAGTLRPRVEALRRVAGQAAVDLIRIERDPVIAAMVETWPQRFETARAVALGAMAESSFDHIIAGHLEATP